MAFGICAIFLKGIFIFPLEEKSDFFPEKVTDFYHLCKRYFLLVCSHLSIKWELQKQFNVHLCTKPIKGNLNDHRQQLCSSQITLSLHSKLASTLTVSILEVGEHSLIPSHTMGIPMASFNFSFSHGVCCINWLWIYLLIIN